MQKIVICCEIGGFSLDYKTTMRYAELKGINLYPYLDSDEKEGTPFEEALYVNYSTVPVESKGVPTDWSDWEIERDDPALVQAVEEMGEDNYELKVVEIPDGVEWVVMEQDCGREWIAEKHRTWS